MKNFPFMVIKLLNALKGFYTFKELEEFFNIPRQVLWRYTSLHNVPEKHTIEKIMKKINELKLFERVLDKVIKINGFGFVETWRYTTDVHFLNIVGYMAAKFVGNAKIDVVFTVSEDGAPLATVISEWLKARTCVAKRELYLNVANYLTESYISETTHKIVSLFIPKEAIPKESSVLIVDDLTNSGRSIEAAIRLTKKARASVWGVLTVISLNDSWLETINKFGINNVKVLKRLGGDYSLGLES